MSDANIKWVPTLQRLGDFLRTVSRSLRQSGIDRLFGRPALRTAEAQQKLANGVQQEEESYTSYIEDILALSKRVDPKMGESEKIRHITKGIREGGFQILDAKNATANVVTLSKTLEDARRSRIRLPIASPVSMNGDSQIPNISFDALRTLVHEIVREEQDCRGQPTQSVTPLCGSDLALQSVIRQEVLAAMPSPQLVSADELRQDVPPPPAAFTLAVAPMTPIAYPSRNHCVQYQRGPAPTSGSFRPVCYYCGIQRHVSRFCRRRERDERFYGKPERSFFQPRFRDRYYPGRQSNNYRDPPYSDDHSRLQLRVAASFTPSFTIALSSLVSLSYKSQPASVFHKPGKPVGAV